MHTIGCVVNTDEINSRSDMSVDRGVITKLETWELN